MLTTPTPGDLLDHVDIERAKREMPSGKTCAHGSHKVRYSAQVPVGSRVCRHHKLASTERAGAATRMATLCEFKLEGNTRPSWITKFILLVRDG